MNHQNHPAEYDRLMETAKKRAAELRSDAIGDFWSGIGTAARRALRSAALILRGLHGRTRAAS